MQAFPSANVSARGGGLNIVVSECEGDDLQGQASDAAAFLRKNDAILRGLLSEAGTTGSLDFGVWQKDVPAWFVRVPADLVALAGGLGLEIEISIYSAC